MFFLQLEIFIGMNCAFLAYYECQTSVIKPLTMSPGAAVASILSKKYIQAKNKSLISKENLNRMMCKKKNQPGLL